MHVKEKYNYNINLNDTDINCLGWRRNWQILTREHATVTEWLLLASNMTFYVTNFDKGINIFRWNKMEMVSQRTVVLNNF